MEDARLAAVIKHLVGNGNNNHPQSIASTNRDSLYQTIVCLQSPLAVRRTICE